MKIQTKNVIYITCWLLSFSVLSMASVINTHASELKSEQLFAALKKGGLVVYIRHAKTDRAKTDLHPVELDNCEAQRNLSDEGRSDAKKIGAVLRRLGVSFATVFSSPYCRCKQTAELITGSEPKIDVRLSYAITQQPTERIQGKRRLLKLLSQPVKTSNRLIVGHTSNLHEATGIWPKEEGEAWVFRPADGRKFEVLGRLKVNAFDEVQF